RLQAKLPSQPMINSATGDRFLFRLIEAEKNHVPASLDEVREAVTRDAHRLAAYRKMLEDRAAFEDELRLKSIADLGEKYGEAFSPTPFTKRTPSQFGTPIVPEVPPIGRNEKFVDAVFDLAT